MDLQQPEANLLRYLARRGPMTLGSTLPWHRDMAAEGLITISPSQTGGVVIEATPAGRQALAGFRGRRGGRRPPA